MQRLVSVTMSISMLAAWAVASGQTTLPGDVRTFELTPAPPPVPAMKYQLLFDDLMDRRPGNAAPLYLDAVLLMGAEAKQNAQKALKAYEDRDVNTFASLAQALDKPELFEVLDLAARREQCDWASPFRDMGIRTLLPHLEPLVHGVARLVQVQALRQIEQGKIDEALATLRLGYELSDKTGREPVLIAGLVSLSMTSAMDDCLARLMNHPESPNLYWALADLPARRAILRRGLDGERGSAAASLPDLARAKAREELSARQWHAILDYVGSLPVDESGRPRKVDAVGGASPEVLRQAWQQYAQAHHLAAGQPANVDPAVALGSFYFREYQVEFDEMDKLRGLPYPALLVRSRDYRDRVAKRITQEPANPFLQLLPTIDRAIWKFARADRQIAALTAVEALRSYAAANGGALPNRLEDVTETPVPQNPATGKPFEYRLEHDTATVSDSQSADRLTYTIKVRNSPR